MCRAVTVWSMGDGEERRPCPDHGDPCYYHRKVRDGLIEPLQPNTTDPYANRPVRVELEGRDIWTL